MHGVVDVVKSAAEKPGQALVGREPCKNIFRFEKERALTRVRMGNVLSLCVCNLQRHPWPLGWAPKGPCLACGNAGSIWNKTHMEKRTEETIQERELGVFQTLSLQRKICRLFFFKEKQAPGNEL